MKRKTKKQYPAKSENKKASAKSKKQMKADASRAKEAQIRLLFDRKPEQPTDLPGNTVNQDFRAVDFPSFYGN